MGSNNWEGVKGNQSLGCGLDLPIDFGGRVKSESLPEGRGFAIHGISSTAKAKNSKNRTYAFVPYSNICTVQYGAYLLKQLVHTNYSLWGNYWEIFLDAFSSTILYN